MKHATAALTILLTLAACGDPPERVEPGSPAPAASADPHAGLDLSDPHAGLDLSDPHAGLDLSNPHAGLDFDDPHAGLGLATTPAAPFRVEGVLSLAGVDAVPDGAVFYLTVRGPSPGGGVGPMWLTKRLPATGGGDALAFPFVLTQDDVMQAGLRRPDGDLVLWAKYHPSGFVEDPDVLAAEPVPVSDGLTGLEIELAAP